MLLASRIDDEGGEGERGGGNKREDIFSIVPIVSKTNIIHMCLSGYCQIVREDYAWTKNMLDLAGLFDSIKLK